MIPYRYLAFGDSPAHGYWDQAMLNDFFQDVIFSALPNGKGSIVVIPGAYQAPYIKEINEELAKLKWVLLIITSDEENKFPIEQIQHDNIKIYLQYPRRNRHEQYGKMPSGYIPTTRENLKFVEKDLDYFFSGQVTHPRRRICWDAIRKLENSGKFKNTIYATDGFAQGLAHPEYLGYMNRAKAVPAPSGNVTADSFRLFEALEAGAVPIADNICAIGDAEFWPYVLGTFPFPTTNDFSNLEENIEKIVNQFPVLNNRAQAWWIKYKRDLKWQLIHDVEALTGETYRPDITVIIPVSVIKSHPETTILDETISTIRAHLPKAEIIITFDGIRPQQEHRRADYEEFIRRALFKCNTEWNAVPVIFDKHHHQSGMAISIMGEIKTPTMLYVEQDTPLAPDMPIDWQKCVAEIKSGHANLIRFHHESYILPDHKHLMIGEPENGLYKTVQWSQRPHLASVEFYKRILTEHFTVNSNCFLEDLLYGRLHEDFIHHGMDAWNRWRTFIYHPEGQIKRSYHTDGRAGEQKFDAEQVW